MTEDLPSVNNRPQAVSIANLVFDRPGSSFKLSLGSFHISAGEKIFLYGPSGCGKSTLLALIAGILSPEKGAIEVDGKFMTGLGGPARDRLRGEKIGLIFQQFNLVPYLGVIDNILLPCRLNPLRRARAEASDGSIQKAADRLLDRLGLDKSLLGRPVTELSVGQQQRVAAARALMGRPPLLLADEPTSALDSDLRADFLDLLSRECTLSGSSLLFVSHDRSLAEDFDRRVAFSDFSEVSLKKPPKEDPHE
ncbi:MAG: ATP-binding cassette domain-containing protein [Deltaproteobacteria bacterium]|jgi:putative ABC transport system ATP-binding protein|nr:ATP-binding cassette domain-containing protein [Deltaproteobacteria bacterium]